MIDRFIFITLLKSHFFFFFNDVKFFLKKGLVYVNGVLVYNPLFILKIGDVIQLVFSKIYFYYKKKIFLFFNKKIKFIKYKRWKFSNPKFKRNFFQWQPSFLENLFFYKIDIPSFLEVDFISLSFSFIKYELNLFKKNLIFFKIFSSIFNRSYNWKRLT